MERIAFEKCPYCGKKVSEETLNPKEKVAGIYIKGIHNPNGQICGKLVMYYIEDTTYFNAGAVVGLN